jgi:hypothetical protein
LFSESDETILDGIKFQGRFGSRWQGNDFEVIWLEKEILKTDDVHNLSKTWKCIARIRIMAFENHYRDCKARRKNRVQEELNQSFTGGLFVNWEFSLVIDGGL